MSEGIMHVFSTCSILWHSKSHGCRCTYH